MRYAAISYKPLFLLFLQVDLCNGGLKEVAYFTDYIQQHDMDDMHGMANFRCI